MKTFKQLIAEDRDPVAPKGSTGKEPSCPAKDVAMSDVAVGDWIKNGGHFYEVWRNNKNGSYNFITVGIMKGGEVYYRETVSGLGNKKVPTKRCS